MAYVLVLQRRLSVIERSDADRPEHDQNRDFEKGVCFQQHAFFKQLFE